MSLYADYLKERTDDQILEFEFGFATYRHLPDQKATYIIDIYVEPKHRKIGLASKIADEISGVARLLGHEKLLGTIKPSAKNSTDSLKALLAYGLRLKCSGDDFIVLEKEI